MEFYVTFKEILKFKISLFFLPPVGGVGWATPKSTGRSSIDDDTDQTIPKQHLLSKVTVTMETSE